MELNINGKDFGFIFGYGFLKEINDGNRAEASGVTLNMGVANVVSGLLIGDVERLIDVLKKANKTETPRLTDSDIDHLFDNYDAETLFDMVMDELKKSQFTTIAVKKVLDQTNQTANT